MSLTDEEAMYLALGNMLDAELSNGHEEARFVIAMLNERGYNLVDKGEHERIVALAYDQGVLAERYFQALHRIAAQHEPVGGHDGPFCGVCDGCIDWPCESARIVRDALDEDETSRALSREVHEPATVVVGALEPSASEEVIEERGKA